MKRVLSACLLWLLAFLAAADVVRNAAPPVARFAPDLDVYPQNFSIAVDDDNQVYVGNTDGVLVFDGEYWHLVELPNGDIVRWLQSDGKGRVYVGGYDAFGYIEPNATGEFDYTELSGLFEAELGDDLFADIWQIVVHDDAVYFLALRHVFRFEPDTGATGYWYHEGSIGPGVSFRNRVYVQFRGEGLKYYDAGEWHSVPGQPDLSRTLLASIVSLRPDDALIISSDGPWYRFDGERFAVVPNADKIPLKASVTRAIALDERTVALATQLGRVVIFDLNRGTSEVIPASTGFLAALAKSRQGDLVGVDDLGFFALPWPAEWRKIGTESGLAGGIHRVLSVAGDTYVMSSSGAFRKRPGAPFERLGWTDYEAWDLLPLEGGDYLFADSYEIKQIHPDGAVDVIDKSTTARVFLRSRFQRNRVYVGTEFGLQILEREGGRWRSVLHADDMDNLRITELIEVAPDELWVGSERGGIRKLTVRNVPDWQVDDELMTGASGIEYGQMGEGAYLFEDSRGMVASTAAGFFRWNGERFERDSLEGLERHRLPNRPFKLLLDDGVRWAWDYGRVYRFDGGWVEQDISALKSGAVYVLEHLDHCVVVGTLGTLLLHEPQPVSLSRRMPDVRVTAASLLAANGESTPLPLDDLRFSSAAGRLILRYALAELANPDAVLYRTRLLPTESRFSPWTEDSQQAFVQLSPGSYQLEIEAIGGDRQVSRTVVPIVVMPRWFETLAARVAAAVALLAVILVLTSWYSRRRSRMLEQERDRLEQIVTERTRALQSANQQLERMAHLDGLTQIPNRRRLDDYLEDVRQQCIDRGRIMAVALIDVDHFKRYNDSFGHQAGDALLIELAKLLSRNLRRAEDLVARYGGEEFLVVLPGAGEYTGRRVIESMRRAVEESDLGVTISAGVHAATPDEDMQVEQMIAAADAAMYKAKKAGRNRVVSSVDADAEASGLATDGATT